MRALDASSALYGWDNYPPELFPSLWAWLGEEIAADRIQLCNAAFDEIGHKSEACGQWFVDAGITRIKLGNACFAAASAMEQELEIDVEGYHPKGVDENDLFIIASAKTHDMELVSNEERQQKLPGQLRKYKIPAVCELRSVSVPCISFLELLKTSPKPFT